MDINKFEEYFKILLNAALRKAEDDFLTKEHYNFLIEEAISITKRVESAIEVVKK